MTAVPMAATSFPPVADRLRWGQSAAATAIRVLEWAEAPCGPPPLGSLRGAKDLLSAPAVTERLRRLVWTTSARLGAGNPPLGDASAIGAGAVLLAASVGGRGRPELAAKLAAALPPLQLDAEASTGGADALARHAIAAPSLSAHDRTDRTEQPDRSGTDNLADVWLDASPLTAVLLAPGPQTRRTALRTAAALAERPHGQLLLTAVLAGCHPDARVLQWRGDVLLRLAAQHPTLVIDIYLAARTAHEAAWDQRLADAVRRLAEAARSATPAAGALPAVHYWAGLTVRPVAEIITRGRLPVDLRPWLALVRRHPAAGVSDL